jgi:hypothetical protein
VVGVVHDGGKVIACRSGDDNLLGTSLEVSRSLFLGGVETGALEHYVYIQLAPRELSGVGLCINGDLLAIHDDGTGSNNSFTVFCEHSVLIVYGVLTLTEHAGETTLGGIILEKVSEHFRTCEVIDGDNFVTISLEHLTECQTTDTAKTVDCNSIHIELFNKK